MKTARVSKSKAPKTTTLQSPRDTAPAKTTVSMSKPTRMTVPQSAPVITTEEIARCAYAIWERQGRPAGKDTEHWLQAEMQLKGSQSFSE